jgi:hypothetical protein
MCKNSKIPSGLLSNLENEYYLEMKHKEIEKEREQNKEKIINEKEQSILI